MWQFHGNYAHGTGHGVGAFLNVHEGPIGLSGSRINAYSRFGIVEPGLQENMVIKNVFFPFFLISFQFFC